MNHFLLPSARLGPPGELRCNFNYDLNKHYLIAFIFYLPLKMQYIYAFRYFARQRCQIASFSLLFTRYGLGFAVNMCNDVASGVFVCLAAMHQDKHLKVCYRSTFKTGSPLSALYLENCWKNILFLLQLNLKLINCFLLLVWSRDLDVISLFTTEQLRS